jgi:hypothetical protein
MSLSAEWISFLSSLFGAIVGAFLAYLFALRQLKLQKQVETQKRQIGMALDFHRELVSNDFALARFEADTILKNRYVASVTEDHVLRLSDKDWRPIRIVTAYFRRLLVAIKYEQIHDRMVIDLLSEEFFWWYFMWLNTLIPDDWQTKSDIDMLHRWLKENMSSEAYEKSKKRSLEQREEHLSGLRASTDSTKQKAAYRLTAVSRGKPNEDQKEP